jgi:hypothetical protein
MSAYYSSLTGVPQPSFFQVVSNYTPISAGLTLIPITVTTALMSAAAGFTVSVLGRYRELIILGWACWSVGLGLLSLLKADSSIGELIGFGVLTGIGVGNTLAISLIALQSSVRKEDMAATTAMRNVARQLGGTLALSIAGTVINNSLSKRASSLGLSGDALQTILDTPTLLQSASSTLLTADQKLSLIDAYRSGFQTMCYLLAGLTAFTCLVTFFMVDQVELRTSTKEEKAKAKQWLEARRRKKTDEPSAPSSSVELNELESSSSPTMPRSALSRNEQHVITPLK